MKIVECSEDIAKHLEEKLLNSLRTRFPQSENSSMVLCACEPEDQIIGGLVASTSYGWLLVKILWVEEHHRRTGVGRSLMKYAESSAVKLGCHAAWLDTSNPEARGFYLKSGFETFAELNNNDEQHPPAHSRWFMKKSL